MGKTYLKREITRATAKVQLARIDDFIDEDVVVMKIDVEAWEGCAILGATKLLMQRNVHFIVLEIWRPFAPCIDALTLLKLLDSLGYLIFYSYSDYSFLGPEAAVTPTRMHEALPETELGEIFLAKQAVMIDTPEKQAFRDALKGRHPRRRPRRRNADVPPPPAGYSFLRPHMDTDSGPLWGRATRRTKKQGNG